MLLLLSLCLPGAGIEARTNDYTPEENAEIRAIVSNSFMMEEIITKQSNVIIKKDQTITILVVVSIIEAIIIVLSAIF